MKIKQLTFFFRIVDDQGQLNIIDISFMATVGKIILAKGIDWPSMVSLVTIIVSKMHHSHIRSKTLPISKHQEHTKQPQE